MCSQKVWAEGHSYLKFKLCNTYSILNPHEFFILVFKFCSKHGHFSACCWPLQVSLITNLVLVEIGLMKTCFFEIPAALNLLLSVEELLMALVMLILGAFSMLMVCILTLMASATLRMMACVTLKTLAYKMLMAPYRLLMLVALQMLKAYMLMSKLMLVVYMLLKVAFLMLKVALGMLKTALVMWKVEHAMMLLSLAKTLKLVAVQLQMVYTLTRTECVVLMWLPCVMSSLMATVMIVQVMAFY